MKKSSTFSRISSDNLYFLDHSSSESPTAAKPSLSYGSSSSECDRKVLGDRLLRLASVDTSHADARLIPADHPWPVYKFEETSGNPRVEVGTSPLRWRSRRLVACRLRAMLALQMLELTVTSVRGMLRRHLFSSTGTRVSSAGKGTLRCTIIMSPPHEHLLSSTLGVGCTKYPA